MSDDKEDRKKLKDFFDPHSGNFLGMGLSFVEMMTLGRIEEIERSYVMADKEERERRLGLIIELSVILGAILGEEELFGTAILQANIEEVLLGDWDGPEVWLEYAEGSGKLDHSRTRCPLLYEKFFTVLRRAYDTRPGGYVHKTVQ